MKFQDDSLRICPNCKKAVRMEGEEKQECPHCQRKVWFFNFKPLPSPPEIPQPRPVELLKNPTSTLLLAAVLLLTLVCLVAISKTLVAVTCCLLISLGFAVFGVVRHREGLIAEESLRYTENLANYSRLMRGRVTELTSRFNSLLATGDIRIEEYYSTIYLNAELEKTAAREFRDEAAADRQAIGSVEQRIDAMAARLVQDHLKWVQRKLRADPENYQRNKIELTKAFDFVGSVGYQLPAEVRKQALDGLKSDYHEKVRLQALKEEQQRIRKQAREDERARREREQAIREAEEQEREAEARQRELQQQLDDALARQSDQHSGEIEELRRQIAEADARAAEAHAQSERAISMAQLTKAGHVYILSNLGSFGENVYKVGMTRRLEPNDRVRELGDASVPFPFDVHAMISCDDAPSLERQLHRELTRYRVNRINLRKEYFRVELDEIISCVMKHHGRIDYVAEIEALEYREGLDVTAEQLMETEAEIGDLAASVLEDMDE